MLDWNALSQKPDFILENGMTVKDYYNKLYFGSFFSIDDMQLIMNSEIVNSDNIYQISKRLEFLFKEAHPELFNSKEKLKESLQKARQKIKTGYNSAMEKTMTLAWLMCDAFIKAFMIIFWYAVATAAITPLYTYLGIL